MPNHRPFSADLPESTKSHQDKTSGHNKAEMLDQFDKKVKDIHVSLSS